MNNQQPYQNSRPHSAPQMPSMMYASGQAPSMQGNVPPYAGQRPQPPMQPGGSFQQPGRQSGTNRGGRFPWLAAGLIALAIVGLIFLGSAGMRKLKEKQVAQEIAAHNDVYGPNIYINDVSIAGMTPDQALKTLSQTMYQRVHDWSLALTYNGWTYYNLNYPALGITFSEEQLYPYLNEAWALTHTGDVFERQKAIAERADTPYQVYTTKKEFDDTNLTTILDQIAQSINTEPRDAALLQFRPDEADPFLIQDEQEGRRLDTEEAKQQILERAAAGNGGSFELQPTITQPTVTRADIAKTVALRSEATTEISKESIENRNNNIRVAMSKINGLILKPGEQFSFNKVVGPRTLKDGFFEAEEMVSGDLVTGVGGGVCQVSTTIYQAALKSDLKIVKRGIHSVPVRYTEMGQDATVFLSRDREIDFVFKNTSEGLLYISAHVEQGATKNKLITRVRMYGQSLGENVTYRLNSVIDQVLTSFDVEYKSDQNHENVTYKDETKLMRKAQDGYQVSTYLRKYVDGVMVDEKLVSTDKYLPRPAVYWRGTMDR